MAFLSSNIGIDIGSKFTKIVILKKDRYTYHTLPTPDNCINDGRIIDGDRLSSAFKDFFKKNKIMGQLCFSLSCADIIIREIYMPRIDEVELKSAVKFEASKYIPVLFSDYVVDYKVLGEGDKGLRVLLVACPRAVVEGYVDLSSRIGMKVKAIDIFPNAVIKALNYFKLPIDGPTAFIDMGSSRTKVLIADNGSYGFYRELPFGCENVALLLANKYNMDLKTAEDKIQDGSFNTDHIVGFFDGVIREIDGIFNYYSIHWRNDVSSIYISGGLSNLKGLEGLLGNYFDVKTEVLEGDMKYMLAALGAALRGDSHKGH
ncbi:pilus assembly protein PilM [Caldanaerobius polysaccharolyticus]|uniref:pilus assembly protein PilM n=1 Tax=Caldanaerobius polysaccharolyticus TaxID=44256 RepID=UPI00047AC862|nr:pilus assembly protein PilM [Caldanaerobius polysaccharolyticus]